MPTSTSSRRGWGTSDGPRVRANGRPKTVYIVHGDPDAAEAFAVRIRSELGMDAHVPQHRETVSLG